MSETTIDPSVLQFIGELAQALQMHHLGLTTTEPFARTYERDQSLLNQAENFLSPSLGPGSTLVSHASPSSRPK